MTKATDLLEELALKAAVQLHCVAESHRSRARSYERRLNAPDALRRTQAEVDRELRAADENEALFNSLSNAVIEVRAQRQERGHRRSLRRYA